MAGTARTAAETPSTVIMSHRDTYSDTYGDGIALAERELPLSVAAALRYMPATGALRLKRVTGSTNADLVQEARRGFTEPCALVADRQTAGRGRLGRRWRDAASTTHGPSGSLLVSFRFRGRAEQAAGRVAAVAAAAMDAACDAVATATTATAVHTAIQSKWPNDLLLGSPSASGKLAGVLAEIVAGSQPVIVVGVGVNLAPVPREPGAVSLAEAGVFVTRDELLAGLLEALPTYLRHPMLARRRLDSASATTGRRVRVELVDGTAFTGRAKAVDSAGRLIVDTGAGATVVEAGDVHHLRRITVREGSAPTLSGGTLRARD